MKYCPTCHATYADDETFCSRDGSVLVAEEAVQHEQTGPLSAPNPRSDEHKGAILSGRYRLGRAIGRGGMGVVYEAEHLELHRGVAIKVLRHDFSSRPDLVERFRQEARSASRIGHPNIVDILDFGTTSSGSHYFVMELLVGEDLAAVLQREKQLPPSRALNIAIQCCEALGAAHQKGIVHRDIKPGNIFLVRRAVDGSTHHLGASDSAIDTQDTVKIVDFGIAKITLLADDPSTPTKLTHTGMIFGTPEYMSPEQAAGKTVDARADIYSLGIILYEMLTGVVPFRAQSFLGVLTSHLFEPPPSFRDIAPSLHAPPGLEQVVQKALAKDPNERFASAHELMRALQHIEATDTRGHTIHDLAHRSVSTAKRTQNPVARRSSRLASAAAWLFVTSAVAAGVWRCSGGANHDAPSGTGPQSPSTRSSRSPAKPARATPRRIRPHAGAPPSTTNAAGSDEHTASGASAATGPADDPNASAPSNTPAPNLLPGTENDNSDQTGKSKGAEPGTRSEPGNESVEPPRVPVTPPSPPHQDEPLSR